MSRPFERAQFYEALTLVIEAKMRGLNNLGLIKIKLEADALTNALYPAITMVTDTGKHYEYIGDNFYDGLERLRSLIAKARKEVKGNG